MIKGFTNEELVKNYKESGNERFLEELIKQNTPLLRILVEPYLATIPNSELEDLISESYIPMLKAIEDFDESRGLAFITLLKAYVRQNLNRIYNEATRKKRYIGSDLISYDALTEINKEGGCELDSHFSVECEDVRNYEFQDLLRSLGLNEKEWVAVNVSVALIIATPAIDPAPKLTAVVTVAATTTVATNRIATISVIH